MQKAKAEIVRKIETLLHFCQSMPTTMYGSSNYGEIIYTVPMSDITISKFQTYFDDTSFHGFNNYTIQVITVLGDDYLIEVTFKNRLVQKFTFVGDETAFHNDFSMAELAFKMMD